MQKIMEHLVRWLVVSLCVVVQASPIHEENTAALGLQASNDTLKTNALATLPVPASPHHQSRRRATPRPPRILDQTPFGTKTMTWPTDSTLPGDYQQFSTLYKTSSTSTRFRNVKFEVQVIDGPGICPTDQIENWNNASPAVTWGKAKEDVKQSDPTQARENARRQAQTGMEIVQQAYNANYAAYNDPVAAEVEWSQQMPFYWTVQVTTNPAMKGFAFTTLQNTWDKNPVSIQPSARAYGVASLIIARTMLELILRKLVETRAEFTALDALYTGVAIWVTLNIYIEARRLAAALGDVPSQASVEQALQTIGLLGASPLVVRGHGLKVNWTDRGGLEDLLHNKVQNPCRHDHTDTIETS